ncbi:MAG: F0F1 ATP synthase subunit B [Faecousia sp.]
MEGFQNFIGVNLLDAVFVLLNTLLIFFCAKKFLFVPVKKMIDDRQKEIDDMYAAADTAKTDAQTMRDDYEKKLNDAKQTSEEIVRDAVLRGQNRQEEIIRAANAEADAIRDKAVRDIALEKKKALNDAKDEISVVAVAIAEKVVSRKLDTADQEQLIAEFIDNLGE